MSTNGTEMGSVAERPIPATVLIVEDEDATRSLCRDVAAESGLRTRTASTTEQALEILDAAHDPCDAPDRRQRRVVRMHRELHVPPLRDGQHRIQEILEIVPQLLFADRTRVCGICVWTGAGNFFSRGGGISRH